MAENDKNDGVSGRPNPDDGDLVNELRELVTGGAVYEERRAPGKAGGASRIVNDFSDERRTPSRSGLPKWRATATESGTPATVRDADRDGSTTQGTDPGLGPSVVAGSLSTDFTETYVGHQTTVELPLALDASVAPHAAVAPDAAPLPRGKDPAVKMQAPTVGTEAAKKAEEPAPTSKPPKGRVLRRENVKDEPVVSGDKATPMMGRMVTLPDGDRGALAESIATQVRQSSKAAVHGPEDATPDAPPVESRRVEKRTELRIGVAAGMLAMLIAGILIGRWFWQDRGALPRAAGSAEMAATMTAVSVPMTAVSASVSSAPPDAVLPPSMVAPSPSTPVKAHGPKHPEGPGHGVEPRSGPVPSAAVTPAVTTPTPFIASPAVSSGRVPFILAPE